MSRSTAIILGSAHPKGDTYEVCSQLEAYFPSTIYNLSEFKIAPFDYEFNNQGDDFLPLIKKVIEKHDRILFVSPVYWYSVSAQMKIFIDRLSDLLKIEKDLGRQLRGKSLGLVSRSHEDDCPPEFAMPIQRTADYLGMEWMGHIHFFDEGPSALDLSKFVDKVS